MTSGVHCCDYYPGTLSSLSSRCNSYRYGVPVDFIYEHAINQRCVVTWCRDTVWYHHRSTINGHRGDKPSWKPQATTSPRWVGFCLLKCLGCRTASIEWRCRSIFQKTCLRWFLRVGVFEPTHIKGLARYEKYKNFLNSFVKNYVWFVACKIKIDLRGEGSLWRGVGWSIAYQYFFYLKSDECISRERT